MTPRLSAQSMRGLSAISRPNGYVVFATTVCLSVFARVVYAESPPTTPARVITSEAQWIQESRMAAKDFAMRLRTRLQAGLQQGAVAAIEICHREASDIASEVGAKHERRVSRSSSRVRNAENSPDQLDQKIIVNFQDRLAAGESIANIEFIEDRGMAGKIFAKPLVMDAVCLMCHGDNMPSDVAVVIKTYYPKDEATGFKFGELRGILRVDQVVN